jgi:hypothetical protein
MRPPRFGLRAAHVEVVAPCGDLVSGDLERAHARSLAWLSLVAVTVDALGQTTLPVTAR